MVLAAPPGCDISPPPMDYAARRSRGCARGVFLLALVAFGAGLADATTLCAALRGKVTVREGCKRREKTITPLEGGVVGATGAQGAMGLQGPPGMVPYQ